LEVDFLVDCGDFGAPLAMMSPEPDK
jgi:hypothetical protein